MSREIAPSYIRTDGRTNGGPTQRALAPARQLCIGDQVVFTLLDSLRELSGDQRNEVARAVAVLWGSLVVHFRGLDGFLAADGDAQLSYLTLLAGCAKRLAPHRCSLKGHNFFAVAIFCAYLAGWLAPRSAASISLGTCVVAALVRGRSLMQDSVPPLGSSEVCRPSVRAA